MGSSSHNRIQNISDACSKEMYSATIKAKNLAIEKGDIDPDGFLLVPVITDACFSKRTYGIGSSYSALSAAGSTVSLDTGKIIWSNVANKYCRTCVCHKSSNSQNEFLPHNCNRNFVGPSTVIWSPTL